MEALYENRTTLTKDDYLKFYRFSYFILNKVKIVVFNVLFIIIDLLGIKLLQKSIILGIIQIIISSMAFAYVNSLPFLFGNIIWNKIRNRKDCIENIVKFYNDYILIKNVQGKKKLKYCEMYKVIETSDYIYIFQNRNQANILRKDSFTVGEMNKCIKMIKQQINKRFDEYK